MRCAIWSVERGGLLVQEDKANTIRALPRDRASVSGACRSDRQFKFLRERAGLAHQGTGAAFCNVNNDTVDGGTPLCDFDCGWFESQAAATRSLFSQALLLDDGCPHLPEPQQSLRGCLR